MYMFGEEVIAIPWSRSGGIKSQRAMPMVFQDAGICFLNQIVMTGNPGVKLIRTAKQTVGFGGGQASCTYANHRVSSLLDDRYLLKANYYFIGELGQNRIINLSPYFM